MEIIQLREEFDEDKLKKILDQDRRTLESAKQRLKELEEDNRRHVAMIMSSFSQEELSTFLNGDFSCDFSPPKPKKPKLRLIK